MRMIRTALSLSAPVVCLLVGLLASGITASSQTLAVDLAITVSDGAGGTQELRFGLAPAATDTIDVALGERERPPLPPGGIFDARFVGSEIGIAIGEGMLKDYRKGETGTTGTRIHELRYQTAPGNRITISWTLPSTVHGLLQDLYSGVLIRASMTGSGSCIVENPGIYPKLLMTVTYGVTAVNTLLPVPSGIALEQNYPNPFNPRTTIQFTIVNPQSTILKVYDMLGREVAVLVDEHKLPGEYSATFTAASLASGVYQYRLVAGQATVARTMVLMK